MLGGIPVRPGDQEGVVGLASSRGPDLLAVDDPLVAVPDGPGPDPGQVRSRSRLGVQQAHVDLTEHQRSDELRLQIVGSEGQEGVGPQVHLVLAGAVGPDGGEFLVDHPAVGGGEVPAVVGARPARGGPARIDQRLQPGLTVGTFAVPVGTQPGPDLLPNSGGSMVVGIENRGVFGHGSILADRAVGQQSRAGSTDPRPAGDVAHRAVRPLPVALGGW